MRQKKKVLILAEHGFEDLELGFPKLRLREEGIEVLVASVDGEERWSKHHYPAGVSSALSEIDVTTIDGVVIPGGRECPDRLRTSNEVLNVVRALDRDGKVVAAICHAAWVPISAGIVQGREMTCYYSIRDDLANAGGKYSDAEVVVDGNLVSSRVPDDLPAFCQAIIRCLWES